MEKHVSTLSDICSLTHSHMVPCAGASTSEDAAPSVQDCSAVQDQLTVRSLKPETGDMRSSSVGADQCQSH